MKNYIILQIKGLTKSFGKLRVLDGVNFSLESKALCALIGPNGAGKSTLFNVITGLLKGDDGTVVFDGIDITNERAYAIPKRGLSRTFQIVSIFPMLSSFDNVQTALISHKREMMNFFSRGRGMFREEVHQLLEFVGLGDKADMISGNLPHGDKKRLELSIALANEPRMLLLDEPTNGMAPEETGEIMGLVKRLRDELGLTIFFVEHDMKAVFGWAERVIVLHQGKIIADGLPMEISSSKRVREVYLGD